MLATPRSQPARKEKHPDARLPAQEDSTKDYDSEENTTKNENRVIRSHSLCLPATNFPLKLLTGFAVRI